MTDLEEALRSELRYRAEAADREVSLLEPVARRVRRAHRRCALAASTLTTIAATAITVAVPASSVLQPVTAAGPVTTAGRIAAPAAPTGLFGLPSSINGLERAGPAIDVGPSSSCGTPDVGLAAIQAGPEAGRVPSVVDPHFAQSVKLAYSPRGHVPAGWRWHDIGGISIAAPASWAVTRSVRRHCPDEVAPTTVVLSTATVRYVYVPGCSGSLLNKLRVHTNAQYAADDVRYAAAGPAPHPSVSLCQWLGGVRACVLWPGGSLLKVAVFPPGAASPILIEIGPVSSAATARAIFDSIRPVLGQRVMAPRWGQRAAVGS